MSEYTVRYTRDEEGAWTARVLGVKGVLTYGRSLHQARTRIREALALAIGDEEAEAAVLVDDVVSPKGFARDVSRVRRVRAKAEALEEQALEATVFAALRLVRDGGLSVRDAGELLGLSHMRVQQLVSAYEKGAAGDQDPEELTGAQAKHHRVFERIRERREEQVAG